jgi:plastocyanin
MGSEQESQATGPEASASGDAVEIAEFIYEPEDLTVPTGTTVTWTNQDKAPHTATAEDSSFDTGTLQKGDAGEVTLDDPGSYAYYCRFHRFMEATVTVE